MDRFCSRQKNVFGANNGSVSERSRKRAVIFEIDKLFNAIDSVILCHNSLKTYAVLI